mgnify:CR=1 FL=1
MGRFGTDPYNIFHEHETSAPRTSACFARTPSPTSCIHLDKPLHVIYTNDRFTVIINGIKTEEREIMEKIRVALQGVQGAHTTIAVDKAFPGKNVELVVFPTYELAFEAVENKDCDYAVIPMENSMQGSIHSNYYLLARKFLYIVNEVYVPIHYSLIGLPDAKIEDISLVIAHPGALEVCRGYIESMPRKPNIETVYDSAASVEMLSMANSSAYPANATGGSPLRRVSRKV